jgi:hypothetical protein
MGIRVSDLVTHSTRRNRRKKLPFLDLWIEVLDELISWQISLLTIFYAVRKEKALSKFDLCIVMILGKIICDSISFRHIIFIGYDTSARALLRSTAEYMEIFVAILHDPSLAQEFAETNDLDLANKFWHKHISKGKIRKKILIAWQSFFRESGDDAARWFSEWGHSQSDVLAASSHPSFIAGVMSMLPMQQSYDEENWLGLWGDKADISVGTVFIYVTYMFPVLLLSREFPFENYEKFMGGKIVFDQKDELHNHVRKGRDVLASLILSLVKESNSDLVFPELDESIYLSKEG